MDEAVAEDITSPEWYASGNVCSEAWGSVVATPFKYRFFGTVRQRSALVLAPDVCIPVCARADGAEKVAAASWAQ
jgi:hypothetical protein